MFIFKNNILIMLTFTIKLVYCYTYNLNKDKKKFNIYKLIVTQVSVMYKEHLYLIKNLSRKLL